MTGAREQTGRAKNLGRSKRLEEELAVMKPLPAYCLNDYRECKVPVFFLSFP